MKSATFRILNGRTFEVTGQTARALIALVLAGERGCTSLEVSSWRFDSPTTCSACAAWGRKSTWIGKYILAAGAGRYRLRTGVQILESESLEA
jgi:hypothetical protein